MSKVRPTQRTASKDMPPCLPRKNKAGISFRDSVFLCQPERAESEGMVGENSANNSLVNFGAAVTLAARQILRMRASRVIIPAKQSLGIEPSPLSVALRLPALRYLVGLIVELCSEKQMPRIAARGIVAPMAGEQAKRLSAAGNKESYAMRSMSMSTRMEQAVVLVVPASNPRPAIIRPFLLYGFMEPNLVLLAEMKDVWSSHISKSLSFLVSVCRLLITAANAPNFSRTHV